MTCEFCIDYSGEQRFPQNLNLFSLSDIEHIKNGEQCSPLQKSIKEISLIKTNFHHNCRIGPPKVDSKY